MTSVNRQHGDYYPGHRILRITLTAAMVVLAAIGGAVGIRVAAAQLAPQQFTGLVTAGMVAAVALSATSNLLASARATSHARRSVLVRLGKVAAVAVVLFLALMTNAIAAASVTVYVAFAAPAVVLAGVHYLLTSSPSAQSDHGTRTFAGLHQANADDEVANSN